jgi:hypothetical protein
MSPCLGCGQATDLERELDFTDDTRRKFPCCEDCGGGATSTPALRVVLAAFKKYGEMPLNPNAAARECPLCGAADERKCGCL